MTILHLLRHAKASRAGRGEPDHGRPLNERGHAAAALVAGVLAAAPPALILTSDARRTLETTEALLRALRPQPHVIVEPALFLAESEVIRDAIRALPPQTPGVVVVGHNPGLHDLALLLASGRPSPERDRLAARFPTAALATFRIDGPWPMLAPSRATLVRFLVPADLDGSMAEDA